MTPIAEALKPYTLYLIYGQIFLLSLAIFVGALLIIRRLWRREPVDGAQINDRDKLAAEIHEEILRLQDLRNRLDPSFVIEGKDISAAPIMSALHSSSASGSTESALSQIEAEEKIQKATADLTQEIAALTQKLTQSEKDLKAAKAAAEEAQAAAARSAASGAGEQSSEDGLVAQMSESEERALVELQSLKEKLEDYQSFEDDIALVKQYKAEIERLQAQLASMKEGAPLGVSEDDIADLFAEMGSSGSEKQVFKADPRQKEEKHVFKADEPELGTEKHVFSDTEASSEPVVDELEAILAQDAVSAEPQAALEEEVVLDQGYVAEPRMEEPGLPEVNEENAEAMAELGEEDPFMAEFEKVLNTKDQEKN